MTLRELGVGNSRTFQQPRPSRNGVEFLAPEPRPPAGNVEAAGLMLEAAQHAQSRFQELPPATGTLPYRLRLDDVLAADDMSVIRNAGKLVLHACGDSGGINNDSFQHAVAAHMAQDFDRPRREDRPAFFYHLGDVVYFKGEESKYFEQFYEPYEHYPAPIFAIGGNHDGEYNRGIPSLQAFMTNFCARTPGPSPDSQTIPRDCMTQPNVYFTLLTPLATIIGLYSNVPEGGEIRHDQVAWFTDELRAAPAGLPVIVAVHHPVFSADVQHSGSPHIKRCIEQAVADTGRVPDLILTGHVHNYQRFTWRLSGRQIPVVVAGAGGYPNLHKVACVNGHTLRTPFELRELNATLEAYCDTRHGFLRLEITGDAIAGKYYTVPDQGNEPSQRVDRFRLDLATHKVGS